MCRLPRQRELGRFCIGAILYGEPVEGIVVNMVRIVFLLLVALSMLIGSAVLIGMANSAPSEMQAMGFDLCKGRPCFLGIIPGNTDMRDAMQILELHGHDLPTNAVRIKLDNGLSAEPAGPIITLTGRDYYSQQEVAFLPLLGAFVETYGKPCGIIREYVPAPGTALKSVYVLYPYLALQVPLESEHLDVDARVQGVLLSVHSDQGNSSRCANSDGVTSSSWFSFTTVENFFKHGLLMLTAY